MTPLVVVLAFQEPGRRPVSIASVNAPELVERVAKMALAEAQQCVEDLAESNPTMARLRAAEFERLRASLEILLPGLDLRPAQVV